MNLMRTIDDIIQENSLLKHKFYRMWSDGDLKLPMLAGYSKEYYQLVKAVPRFMEQILEVSPDTGELEANMQEEYEHVPLWEDFAAELGVPRQEMASYAGLEKTRRAVSDLQDLMGDYSTGAAAMYALEKEIPEVSRTKLEGLSEFYGITDDAATAYFVQHMEADIRHAASWRHILEGLPGDCDGMIRAAQESVQAQNLLLDACYEEYCNNN